VSKQQWVQIKDVKAFLDSGRTVRGVHAFTKRILHWPYCVHCGLVLLRNDTTRRAAKAACLQLED
jgi:hypothetical protein